MSKIKIEVEIESTNTKHVLALSEFMRMVAGEPQKQVAQEPEKIIFAPENLEPKEDIVKPLKKASKAKEEVEPEEDAKPVEPISKPKDPNPKSSKQEGPTKEEVRAVLAKKVGEHRSEIKNKLTELGASSVSTLEAKHFQDFIDFLNNL